MEVYFDNAATTKVSDKAAQAMFEILTENYGNPSSLHNKGFAAEKEVEQSRQTIASILKVQKKEVYFTSGGTEANNMVLYGVLNAYQREGKHVLVSSIEHPSVKDAAFSFESLGYEIETIPTDEKGYIDPSVIQKLVREDTILVSFMHVNNEIGTVQDADAIVKAIKAANRNTIIHMDAVQSFGKYELYPSRIGIDLFSISAHKIHGPKGCGAVYVSPKVRMKPLFVGGSQQNGVRSGTENVPGIVGFGIAAEEAYKDLDVNKTHIQMIRDYAVEQLSSRVEGIEFNSDVDRGAYHILNLRVVGVKSEVLLHTLEEAGIYVSTGSACSSNKKNHSSTLQAIGQDSDATDQAIRLSFSKFNTKAEVDYLVEKLNQSLPLLRRFIRK